MAARQVEATVRMRVDSRARGPATLSIRATGPLPSGGFAVTEAKVPVMVRGK